MDLSKVFRVEEVPIEFANSRLNAHDCLVSWHSQIDDPVVESHVLLHDSLLLLPLFLLFRLCAGHGARIFESLVFDASTGVSNLEGKHRSRFVNAPDLLDVQLHLNGARLDLLVGFHSLGHNLDDRFWRDCFGVTNHAGRSLRKKHDSLDGLEGLAHVNEAVLFLAFRVINATLHTNDLSIHARIDVFDCDVFRGETRLWVTL